jgi:hypothetical protein
LVPACSAGAFNAPLEQAGKNPGRPSAPAFPQILEELNRWITH